MATIYKKQLFQGYIKPQHNVHGPIRFTYKGLWPFLRAKYFADIRAANDDEAGEAVAISTMAGAITQWNLVYPDHHPDQEKRNKPVPINAEVIRDELMTHVRNHMMGIITFGIDSDVDPEATIAEQMKQIQQKASRKTLAEIMAEGDEALVGNSSEVLD